MTAHVESTSLADRIGAVLTSITEVLTGAVEAGRAAREAERLFAMSDHELARRGLSRDAIMDHAFARYVGQ